MRLMLLTDIPPCSDLTAGLVLAKLCRFIPEGGVSCFTVLNKHLNPKLYPDLDGMPLAITEKPNEFGRISEKHPRLTRLASMAIETERRMFQTPRLIDEAVSFGEAQGADAVLAVLQGQTMARLAKPVARRLGADLYTLVWDPLSWWMRAHHVDRFNRIAAHSDFDAAIRASKAVATASWAMADAYRSKYGVRAVPVIASHNQAEAGEAAETFRTPGELVIGMAGQFYSSEEWWQLVVALNHAGWRVGDRRVKLLVYSHQQPVGDIPEGHLDFRGFAPQAEVVCSLARDADILYCPYPFKPEMREVAELSFPSKLAMYLGCGRPVLFHGPSYSSPYKYLESRGAGVLCKDLDPPAVYNALCWLVEDPALYGRTGRAGMQAFRTDFTLDRMRESIFEFLGVGPEAFAQAPKRRAARTRTHLPALIEGARRQRQSLGAHIAALEAEPPPVQPLPHPALAEAAAAKLNAAVEANLALTAKLTRVEAEKAEVEARAAALHGDLQSARTDLHDVAELQAQLAGVREELQGAVRDLEARERELDATSRARESVEHELSGARARVAELEKIIESQAFAVEERAAAFAELRALREQIEASREEHSLARLRALGAEKKLEVIGVSLEHLREEGAALRTQREDLRTQLDQTRQALLQAEAKALTVEEEQRRSTDGAAVVTQSLQHNLDVTMADRDRLIEQLRRHEQWLLEAKAAQASLQNNLDLTIERLREERAALRAQQEDLRTQLDETRQALLQAEAKVLAAGEELRRSKEGAEVVTRSLQHNLDLTMADRDRLIEQLRRHEQWLSEAKAAQASLQNNLDLTIADRAAVKERFDAVTEQHAALKARHEELERIAENRIAALLGKMSNIERQIDADRWARLGSGKPVRDGALRERYLDLIEAALTGTVFEDAAMSPWSKGYDPLVRSIGRDWPAHAMTMIGTARMRNLRHMVELTLREQVPGDYIETGAWRGGACIYMAAILAAYGDSKRKVWVADSFEGLPPPDVEHYPADAGDRHHTVDALRVSLEEVQANFARFGLLDARVEFLKGWFKDTLPGAPIERLAILRLDGDMYSSTMEALEALYDKVSPGGVVIVDDYILPACKQAIDDFRARRGIDAPLVEVDGAAVYWRNGPVAQRSRRAPAHKRAAE